MQFVTNAKAEGMSPPATLGGKNVVVIGGSRGLGRVIFGTVHAEGARVLRPGAMIILISSGAAIGGSPIFGGYAGAKRMQMFLANYCQKESDRLGLGLRFVAIAPACIMPDTGVGKAAVSGYSRP